VAGGSGTDQEVDEKLEDSGQQVSESARGLTTFAEETAQEFGGFFGEDSLVNLHLVIELRMIEDREHRAGGACFGVGGGEDEAVEAGVDHGSGAHGAGLKRDIERAAEETIVTECGRCFAHGDDLGVGCWVCVAQDAVLASSDDCSVMNHDGANGDFAGRLGEASLRERGLHGVEIAERIDSHDDNVSAAGCC